MKTMAIILLLLGCFIYNPLNSQITWEAVNFQASGKVSLIEIGPDNTIYAVSRIVSSAFDCIDSIYQSTDSGKNWEYLMVDDFICNDICFSLNNEIYLVSGFWIWGGIYSGKNEQNWEFINLGQAILKAFLTNDGRLLAISVGNLMHVDIEKNEWQSIFDCSSIDGVCASNYVFGNETLFLNDLTFSNFNEYILASNKGLFRSKDEGETWKRVNFDHPANYAEFTNNGSLVVATENEGIYAFDEKNNEWELLGLDGKSIQSFLLEDEETIIVSTAENGIYYTNDMGQNWVSCNEGLDSLTLTAMAIAPTGHIYVSTGHKVFKSNETFEGIYQAPNSTGIKRVNNNNSHLYSNYPNPFSEQTIISFSLDKEQEVCLSVYNSQGQLVGVILNEYKAAGTHKVCWQAGNNPPGIYYYRLETANGTALSKPMLLVNN